MKVYGFLTGVDKNIGIAFSCITEYCGGLIVDISFFD